MNIKKISIFILIAYLFSGCSNKNVVENIDMSNNDFNPTFTSASLEKLIKTNHKSINSKTKTTPLNIQSEEENINTTKSLNNDLYSFYKQWQGVKYKFGGNSKKGIDCSAFIQKAFKEKLDLKIPRTTALQSKVGKEINKDELETGDLVFFRDGRNRHVGIYMEDGNFMHASTKKGVTISKLSNSYFSKNYWKSQRIID